LSFRFKVARRADRQIRAEAAWWLKNRSGAPTMFADDLNSAFDLIEEFPHAGEAVDHPQIPTLRRVLLGRAQCYLYYSVSIEERVIEVLALWHTSRGSKPRL
jgi:plasmid stabilization system protein ParE